MGGETLLLTYSSTQSLCGKIHLPGRKAIRCHCLGANPLPQHQPATRRTSVHGYKGCSHAFYMCNWGAKRIRIEERSNMVWAQNGRGVACRQWKLVADGLLAPPLQAQLIYIHYPI